MSRIERRDCEGAPDSRLACGHEIPDKACCEKVGLQRDALRSNHLDHRPDDCQACLILPHSKSESIGQLTDLGILADQAGADGRGSHPRVGIV